MTKEQNLKITLAVSSIIQLVDDATLLKINPQINKILDVIDEIGVDEQKAGDE